MEIEELKKKYWALIRRTRKSGRVAQSVVDRVEEEWRKYDGDVVAEALRIHVEQHPDFREAYTLGIMRNLQRQKAAGRPIHQEKRNKFHNFQERKYDYKEMQRQLVNMNR